MEGESGAVTNRVRRSLEGILAMVETNQINIDCLNSRESQLACFTGHELDSFQLLRFSVTGFFVIQSPAIVPSEFLLLAAPASDNSLPHSLTRLTPCPPQTSEPYCNVLDRKK